MYSLTPIRYLILLAVAFHDHLSALGSPVPTPRSASSYPMQTIAGVAVVDTPIVRDAMTFARAHSMDWLFNHVVRTWLLGAIMINADETLRNTVDLEAHAVAALLHDLGLDTTSDSSFVSKDRRFEVDGAFAARDFITAHNDGKLWDEHRLQLVWDAVALHSTPTIANYKQGEVQLVSEGAITDLFGPSNGVDASQIYPLLDQYPRGGTFPQNWNDSMIWLCTTKPSTTYDIWQQPYGDRYVAGYSSKGHQVVDIPVWSPPST